MIRRRDRAAIVVAARPEGVLIKGEPGAVERFRERMREALAKIDLEQVGSAASSAMSVLDALPLTLPGQKDAELFEFSPRAVELLREHGRIPTDDGYFRSMVRDEIGFAGNLDWRPVTSGSDLLQLQNAAVGLALQASIKNLADAVERVETKVDELRDLVRSDQVGEIVAHHRLLTPLAESLDHGHVMSSTDWHSIDDLRPSVLSTIERTRHYIRSRIATVDGGWTAQRRSMQANALLESYIVDSIGLLAAAEHNLVCWHKLRIQRVRHAEPSHLERTIADVERELGEQRRDDQAVVDQLREMVVALGAPTGYEGLEPFARHKLSERLDEIERTVVDFTEARFLDAPDFGRVELPTFSESSRRVRQLAVGTGRRALEVGQSGASRIAAPTADAVRRLARRGGPDEESSEPADDG